MSEDNTAIEPDWFEDAVRRGRNVSYALAIAAVVDKQAHPMAVLMGLLMGAAETIALCTGRNEDSREIHRLARLPGSSPARWTGLQAIADRMTANITNEKTVFDEFEASRSAPNMSDTLCAAARFLETALPDDHAMCVFHGPVGEDGAVIAEKSMLLECGQTGDWTEAIATLVSGVLLERAMAASADEGVRQ